MRITVPQSDLLSILNVAVEAIPQRQSAPVFSTAHITAQKNTCILSAASSEIAIRAQLNAEIERDGIAAFPGRQMRSVIRELPPGPLTITAAHNRVSLDVETGTYTFPSITQEHQPGIPGEFLGERAVIDSAVLLRMIQKVAFAVSQNNLQPTLNGILWRITQDRMLMAATDRHRLTQITATAHTGITSPIDAVIPSHALGALTYLLRNDAPLREVTIREGRIHFAFASSDIFLALIETPYVDIESIIPQNNTTEITVPLHDLAPALKRILVLSDPGSHKIEFSVRENHVELATRNQDMTATAVERLPFSCPGIQLDVTYNGQYLLDILNRIDTDTVRFSWGNTRSAVIVEPDENLKNEQYFSLLMPLRANTGN